MITDEKKKRYYKYLTYTIGYGKGEPQPTPSIYDGSELGRAKLGTMILGKE